MIGTTLGHCSLFKKSGRGRMGVVYRAQDTHLERLAVAKLLTPEKLADSEHKRCFVREASCASPLRRLKILNLLPWS